MVIMTTAPARLAIQLKVMRHRAGLSQSQLEERSGVGLKTISAYETGARAKNAKFNNIVALVTACNYTLDQLLAISPTVAERVELNLAEHQVRRAFPDIPSLRDAVASAFPARSKAA